jgi:hypothetical protein
MKDVPIVITHIHRHARVSRAARPSREHADPAAAATPDDSKSATKGGWVPEGQHLTKLRGVAEGVPVDRQVEGVLTLDPHPFEPQRRAAPPSRELRQQRCDPLTDDRVPVKVREDDDIMISDLGEGIASSQGLKVPAVHEVERIRVAPEERRLMQL